ncbi:hypothetical protein DPMN_177664 [Dreissena polymorpha]|uniref:Uncharacterized protein n=1 Tax=Dreissena polymorpha TaxID=45954 RepID=A0A9D4E961_DREPO|nr:hypothetical protein DPMN_177664 [Dreissena polymorpha]
MYHEGNGISKSQVGDWSFTDVDRGVVVMGSLLHHRLNEKVEQDERDQTSLTNAYCPVLKKLFCCPL